MQKISEEKTIAIVKDITDRINTENLNPNSLVKVLATLLFSVGVSLEDCGEVSSEKVLTRFAKSPTLGYALMAQALHMKDTWVKNERLEEDGRTERDIPRQTEKKQSPDTVRTV